VEEEEEEEEENDEEDEDDPAERMLMEEQERKEDCRGTRVAAGLEHAAARLSMVRYWTRQLINGRKRSDR
jgi:hypothetical protein